MKKLTDPSTKLRANGNYIDNIDKFPFVLRLSKHEQIFSHTLSTTEQLRLIEELWDSLSGSPEAMPLSDEQRGELDRRLDDLESSGPTGIPWEDVLQQIRTRPR